MSARCQPCVSHKSYFSLIPKHLSRRPFTWMPQEMAPITLVISHVSYISAASQAHLISKLYISDITSQANLTSQLQADFSHYNQISVKTQLYFSNYSVTIQPQSLFTDYDISQSFWNIHAIVNWKVEANFRSRRWGSSIPGLRMQDPPLDPPSTWAKQFRRTCLQSHLQTSPPTPQKSYPKFRNPRTTFEIFKKALK